LFLIPVRGSEALYPPHAEQAHRTANRIAKAFVRDMRAYHAEKDAIRRDEIAIRQLTILNEYLGRRGGGFA
jgi:hypothetical protein